MVAWAMPATMAVLAPAESGDGGGEVDALQQPPADELQGGVGGVGDSDHAVGGGGRGVHGAGLVQPERVPGGARGRRENLGHREDEGAEALGVEGEAVAVGVDLVAGHAQPRVGVLRLVDVVHDCLRGGDEECPQGRSVRG